MDRVALDGVRAEIADRLRRAHAALNGTAGDGAGLAGARECAQHLREVGSVLTRVGLGGAAILAGEMEAIAQALGVPRVDDAVAACGALERAIERLPVYVDHVRSGHRDNPVLLLGVINELRAARGERWLAEAELFAPSLWEPLPSPPDRGPVPATEALQTEAAELRRSLQKGLLGWFRGEAPAQGIDVIAAVTARVARLVERSEAWRLWWVAAAVADALRAGALAPEIGVKRLLGQLDRELKRLAEAGADVLAERPPAELLRELLYHVARAGPQIRSLGEIRAAFGLEELAVGAEGRAQAERALAASVAVPPPRPEAGVRPGPERAAALARLRDRRMPPTQGELAAIAHALLALHGTDAPSQRPAEGAPSVTLLPGADHPEPLALTGIEHVQLLGAVIAQGKAELAAVRQAISDFMLDPDEDRRLSRIPDRLRQVEDALEILSLGRARVLLSRWRERVSATFLEPDTIPDPDVLDRLAGAMVTLEQYLDAMRDARAGAADLLTELEQGLEAASAPAVPAERGMARAPRPRPAPAADDVGLAAIPAALLEDLQRAKDLLARLDAAGADDLQTTQAGPREAPDLPDSDDAGSDAHDIGRSSEEIAPAPETGAGVPSGWPPPGDAGREAGTVGDGSAGAVILSFPGRQGEPVPVSAAGPRAAPPGGIERAHARVLETMRGSAADAAEPPERLVPTDEERAALRRLFLEEAVALLDTTDAMLTEWRHAPASPGLGAAVQREIHALAGGARLVGLDAVEALAQALETVLAGAEASGRPVDQEVIDRAQQVHDRLGAAVDALAAGRAVPRQGPGVEAREPTGPAGALLDELSRHAQALGSGERRLGQLVTSARELLAELSRTLERLRDELPGSGEERPRAARASPADGVASTLVPARPIAGSTRERAVSSRAGGGERAETLRDLVAIREALDTLAWEAERVLARQARASSGLGDVLTRARTVPSSPEPRRESLLVNVAGEVFAVPLSDVEAVVRAGPPTRDADGVGDGATFDHGGTPCALVALADVLGLARGGAFEGGGDRPVVVVRAGETRLALCVDEIGGCEALVVQGLGRVAAGLPRYAGAAVLEGGRVVLVLDVPALVRAGAGAARAPASFRSAPTVLVVDDSYGARAESRRWLERAGMRVVTAGGAEEALGRLREGRPDLVVLDVEMPGMDGLELASEIRDDPRTQALPIVAASSRRPEDHRERAAEIGLDGFLRKPLRADELIATVQELLGDRGASA